jgi:hypothetical protein
VLAWLGVCVGDLVLLFFFAKEETAPANDEEEKHGSASLAGRLAVALLDP